ncbi:dTTP/UTP pyrophosphatase [Teleopsis dalmanni]|uniref:dTTP/UTP pyrophosphatase n=1 Tax=Teleopsis dalmanni TaxID=139649 RepID=UPI0018CF6F2B|nr:dTTP/UTP pyrophosphatase [Teleopsis dalmanni]
MLAPIKHVLAKKNIILASGSPRRRELLKSIGLDATACASSFEENLNVSDFKEFGEYVVATALGKADEVYERLQTETNEDIDNLVVIAADTMVTLGDQIYGKPKDAADAVHMLTNLSGKCNRVYTGVVIRHKQGAHKFTDTADVYFGNLTKQQIQAYVDSGDPLDKAGAYGISGPGGAMISRIDGDFYCVMGLPIHRLCVALCDIFADEAINLDSPE